MILKDLLVLAFGPFLASCTSQIPFTYEDASNPNYESSDSYHFKYPIKKVAVIGAGVGGLISYREFAQSGFETHLYERDDSPSGNWHYTEQTPIDAPIPNVDISVGDYVPSLPPKGATLPYSEEYYDQEKHDLRRRTHRAPKPAWKTLSSNAPAPIQQIREFPWPAGTTWGLPVQKLQRYIRAFASWHGLNANDNNPNVWYNTRVELAEKRFDEDGNEVGWTLTFKQLLDTGRGSQKATWWKENYDALAIATGRYNAPNFPSIEGLKQWNEKFPDHILHSRQYRIPDPYTNETVLIVGAHNSGTEISRDLIPHVKKLYQSVRESKTPVPVFPGLDFLVRLPHNVTVVPEIKRFLPTASGAKFNEGQIELVNGTIVSGIDRILFATGLHEQAPRDGLQPIVTDGTHVRSLYLDAFYIPDPTLVFINMNYGYMQSFTHAEFTSLAAAKAWSGKADFPSTRALWEWYDKVYESRRGYGRHFQYLSEVETEQTLRYFHGWLNSAAVKYGGKQIDQLPASLRETGELWFNARLGAIQNGGNLSFSTFSRDLSGIHPETDSLKESLGALVYGDLW